MLDAACLSRALARGGGAGATTSDAHGADDVPDQVRANLGCFLRLTIYGTGLCVPFFKGVGVKVDIS